MLEDHLPMAIFDAIALLDDFVKAYDAGSVRVNSDLVQVGDEAPHAWHEEWIHLAREAVRERQRTTELQRATNGN
jgi:hypothetical protein